MNSTESKIGLLIEDAHTVLERGVKRGAVKMDVQLEIRFEFGWLIVRSVQFLPSPLLSFPPLSDTILRHREEFIRNVASFQLKYGNLLLKKNVPVKMKFENLGKFIRDLGIKL